MYRDKISLKWQQRPGVSEYYIGFIRSFIINCDYNPCVAAKLVENRQHLEAAHLLADYANVCITKHFMSFWVLSQVIWDQNGKTKKVNVLIWIYWSKR